MKIKIHYTFFIFFIISFFCNFFIETFIMFTILLFHELGHLFFLKKYKRKITSITFYVFGGVIKHSQGNNVSVLEDFLISFGGVFVNLILLIVFHQLNLQTFLIINYCILLFNIIPINPLDGSKIIKSILNIFFCYKTSLYLTVIISFVMIVFVFILNIIILKSYYILFLLIALTNINIRYCFEIKAEYQLFLTKKYIYPNEKLKVKKINRFNNPIEKIYLGRNTVFLLDELKVTELVLLKEHFT